MSKAFAAIALAAGGYLFWKQQQDAAGGAGQASGPFMGSQGIEQPAPLGSASDWLNKANTSAMDTYNAMQADYAPQSGGQDMKLGFNFAPILGWGLDRLGGLFGGGSRRDDPGAPPSSSGGSNGSDPVFDLGAWFGGGSSAPVQASAPSGKGPGGVDFDAYERRHNLPTGYLRRTAQIESALNPRAQNPRSSAGGLFQFIDSTARAYGLTNRFDPVQATDAASRLARDNANYLRRQLGREPTGAELYLAHQQGMGGAARLLKNPNARAADIVGSDAVRLNGGSSDMTAREFAGLWLNKYNRGGMV